MRSRSAGRPKQASQHVPAARLHALCALFAGEFLEGLEIDRSPAFNTWLTAQRHRFRACHVALLEHCVAQADGEDLFRHLETWLALAPFDPRAHGALLHALAARGRLREGEEHLAATARLFEAEGLDPAPIRDLWRAARAARPAVGAAPRTPGTSPRAAMRNPCRTAHRSR